MKKLIIISLLSILLYSCADNKTIDSVTYRPYGLFNEATAKNDGINYEVSGWAVFSGIMFSEFFFIPTVYTFGYNLFEPMSKKGKENPSLNGVVK